MTTKITNLNAYREYKQALAEGLCEAEARTRQVYVEQQENLRILTKQKEVKWLNERRQELLQRMRDNQRLLDEQQLVLKKMLESNKRYDNANIGM